eukprot:TRINITY_DN16146_c0_g1_i1.p1 TRINITY_DN16146_c0_g1~~TRINITY_DN16146_c0_g1_i1.p1  ORF type:complete len:225 (-),score=77.93 TRINITY_DN16146_c0_g1_i1:502-1176(-)
MGANQSSRKITVVNDEATGVIKISDSVVQRLKGEISGQPPQAPAPAEPASPPPPAPESSAPPPPPPQAEAPPPPPPQPREEAAPPKENAASSPPPVPVQHEEQQQQMPHIWQRPIIQYIEEPSLSALKVKQEKEEEMKNLEDYWSNRLKKQQDEHAAMNKLNEEEFSKGMNKVQTLFATAGTGAVCRDESEAVRSCYSVNAGKSLSCRNSVNTFVKCVSTARLG